MINIVDDSVFVIDGNKSLEMKYIADEFVWILNSNNMIIDSGSDFYDNLYSIMNNEYNFGDSCFCYKDFNKLIWLSDQYCDLSDEDSVSRVNRLIIDRGDDCFYINIYNPFFEKNDIVRNFYLINFSPLFNGFYSRNINSGLTLQDDFCLMYQKILRSSKHVLKN